MIYIYCLFYHINNHLNNDYFNIITYWLFFINFSAQPSIFLCDIKYQAIYCSTDLQYYSTKSLLSIAGWTQSRHRIANKHHVAIESTSWIVVHPYSRLGAVALSGSVRGCVATSFDRAFFFLFFLNLVTRVQMKPRLDSVVASSPSHVSVVFRL